MTSVPESATRTALQFDDFSFSYENSEEWQLSNINVRIPRSQRVAIMGATGAGKSTFAMALNGLIPHHHEGQTHGQVVVDGLITADHEPIELVRKVGLVMQDPETQITGQTALADAAVGPANFGLPREVVIERATAALGLVGMSELIDRDTNRMSGGQKQRLVVAGVIAMDSDILVLDEPTSELDPQGTSEVFAIVRKLSRESDTSIVLIEHEPELIADWADRLIVLAGGRVAFDGEPRNFFADTVAVARAGLRAPHVSEVANDLVAAGAFNGTIPVTLAEAVASLPPWEERGEPAAKSAPEYGPAVIEARNLSHTYEGGVAALTDVSVSIAAGEFVAVLGRNGAGKTTFARHLNGLLRPTGGELLVEGKQSHRAAVSDLARSVGYVFQNPDHQIFANSVRDEIAYGLKNLGWDEQRITERVDEVLHQVGMTALADRHPFNLGKGQRQRLAVASVLALSPQVLVIDEPTTGQDWLGAQSMMALVRELNEQGHTIVMITHDMALVAEYAARALVFAGGSLVADTSPQELFGNPDLLSRGTLIAPQISELARELGCPRPVTTVDEFRREWGIEANYAV
ncbi:energy-coupling factor transporter ATPase [Salinibacterium amurskyense]|uniref:ABC transporter ATP-binding protein n=1 Tax=Salinibacterium amurskyense TaxID=205941 RepID=UPI00311DCA2D